MRIFLPNIVQENRESINAEKRCKGELSHHGGEGQQCRANDTRPDIGQNNCQKCSPPTASQAVGCLRENSGVDRTQTVIDGAIDERQCDDHIRTDQQWGGIDDIEIVAQHRNQPQGQDVYQRAT